MPLEIYVNPIKQDNQNNNLKQINQSIIQKTSQILNTNTSQQLTNKPLNPPAINNFNQMRIIPMLPGYNPLIMQQYSQKSDPNNRMIINMMLNQQHTANAKDKTKKNKKTHHHSSKNNKRKSNESRSSASDSDSDSDDKSSKHHHKHSSKKRHSKRNRSRSRSKNSRRDKDHKRKDKRSYKR